jgi:hypothetical protein
LTSTAWFALGVSATVRPVSPPPQPETKTARSKADPSPANTDRSLSFNLRIHPMRISCLAPLRKLQSSASDHFRCGTDSEVSGYNANKLNNKMPLQCQRACRTKSRSQISPRGTPAPPLAFFHRVVDASAQFDVARNVPWNQSVRLQRYR